MEIEYSVIIRTTGKAGEKYQRLLDSIAKLVPRPKEVIVVLPNDYEKPVQRLGWETFYTCPKGMVIQRLHGISQCKTKYALISDDDIAFDPDFVQKLVKPLETGRYGISAGPLLEFFPAPGINAAASAIMGAAVPTVFNRDRYNTVLKTTGYSYNRHLESDRIYETQSAPWTCFFADVQKLRSIHFEDELWLDKNGYSAYDDTCMFYKAWLRGVTPVIVADAPYRHMDAKTSTNGNPHVVRATDFNRIVFWHRFLYSMTPSLPGKTAAVLAIAHRSLWNWLWIGLGILRRRNTLQELRSAIQGFWDGFCYISSQEYWELPSVKE